MTLPRTTVGAGGVGGRSGGHLGVGEAGGGERQRARGDGEAQGFEHGVSSQMK